MEGGSTSITRSHQVTAEGCVFEALDPDVGKNLLAAIALRLRVGHR